MFSKGVGAVRRRPVAESLGVKQMEVNDKYLGFHLLKSAFRIDSYNFLFEKIENKPTGWKRIYLTHAGKTILIKHVLGLIPPDYMATSLLSKAVIAKLERIIHNFWWGHNYTTRKTHFINWNRFLDEKVNGGLGIRSLTHLNRAQIAKLGWKILEDENCMWGAIMKAKYFRDESFDVHHSLNHGFILIRKRVYRI